MAPTQPTHRLADLRMKARETIEELGGRRIAARTMRDLLDEAYKRGALDMAESMREALHTMETEVKAVL